jgi:hypothetical protein
MAAGNLHDIGMDKIEQMDLAVVNSRSEVFRKIRAFLTGLHGTIRRVKVFAKAVNRRDFGCPCASMKQRALKIGTSASSPDNSTI